MVFGSSGGVFYGMKRCNVPSALLCGARVAAGTSADMRGFDAVSPQHFSQCSGEAIYLSDCIYLGGCLACFSAAP